MFPTLRVLPFTGWTCWTPVLPKLYWDVYSAEQRLKAMCMELSKSGQYMDYVAESVNEYSENIAKTVESELAEAHRELENLRTELIELIEQTGEGSLDWNVQQGRYTSSTEAMRDMFNDVTVHSITIEELNGIDTLTVRGLADSGLNVKGLAVMSRWLEDDTEPLYDGYIYTD